MGKSQQQFFFFTFLHKKIYILLENMFGKTYFLLLNLYYSFFTWQVNGGKVPTPI